jgi:hypothetical protein
MLVAFQGFPAPPGGKKTGAVMENVFVLGYKYFKSFCEAKNIPLYSLHQINWKSNKNKLDTDLHRLKRISTDFFYFNLRA